MNPQLDNAKVSYPAVEAADFEAEVIQCHQPVLVSFQAPGNIYCQIFNITLSEVAAAYAGRCKIVTVNSDRNRMLCAEWEVEFVPTLLCFVKGAVRARFVGMSGTTAVLSGLNSVLEIEHTLPPADAAAAKISPRI